MAILAQVGYGKSDYVQSGLKDGVIAGAVLCPRYDDPAENLAYAKALKASGKPAPFVLFDPQFYVTAIQAEKEGKLPEYPYYTPSLTRSSFTPTNVEKYVKDVLEFESTLVVSRILSPTVLIHDFRDPWSQIALSLGQESIEQHKAANLKPGLLISLIFDEMALRNRDALNEYLDTITTLKADGFYVIVNRTDLVYPGAYDEEALLNLAYLTHVLSRVNKYEVIHGYADTHAPILSAAGALHTCTGWFSTQRQFSFKPFHESTGGRQARDRYMSGPLMNSIFVNPELESIFVAKQLNNVLTKTKYDGVMKAGPSKAIWSRKTSSLHHWSTLGDLCAKVTGGKDLRADLTALEKLVQGSLGMYATLSTSGVAFEPMNGRRDPALWQKVIARFRTEVVP